MDGKLPAVHAERCEAPTAFALPDLDACAPEVTTLAAYPYLG